MQTIRHPSLLDKSIERRSNELRRQEQDRAMEMHLYRDAAGRACCSEAFDEEFSDEPVAWYWVAAWFVGFASLFAYAWLGGL